MWKKYPKINTLYKRDERNKIIINDFSEEVFKSLKNIEWEATEKIDGTNISIFFDGTDLHFHGRTDNAEIPQHLMVKLNELFSIEKFKAQFPNADNVTIFGEGYGSRIQKGKDYIKDDVSFILFDVNIGGMWLLRDSCENIASQLNISIVPILGYYTIEEAEKIVRDGFKSTIAQNKNYEAEGMVLKHPLCIQDRFGNRLITKIKSRDYKNL